MRNKCGILTDKICFNSAMFNVNSTVGWTQSAYCFTHRINMYYRNFVANIIEWEYIFFSDCLYYWLIIYSLYYLKTIDQKLYMGRANAQELHKIITFVYKNNLVKCVNVMLTKCVFFLPYDWSSSPFKNTVVQFPCKFCRLSVCG